MTKRTRLPRKLCLQDPNNALPLVQLESHHRPPTAPEQKVCRVHLMRTLDASGDGITRESICLGVFLASASSIQPSFGFSSRRFRFPTLSPHFFFSIGESHAVQVCGRMSRDTLPPAAAQAALHLFYATVTVQNKKGRGGEFREVQVRHEWHRVLFKTLSTFRGN